MLVMCDGSSPENGGSRSMLSLLYSLLALFISCSGRDIRTAASCRCDDAGTRRAIMKRRRFSLMAGGVNVYFDGERIVAK